MVLYMMKTGKIPESVLKRSVLKQIKTKREEVVIGAGIGEDCAILSFDGNEKISVTTDSMSVVGDMWQKDEKEAMEIAVKNAFHTSMNNLAASGAKPVAVMVSAFLPAGIEEAVIKAGTEQMEKECASLKVQAAGGHTEVSEAVNYPIITITGLGIIESESEYSVRRIKPGQDIVVSKWIGLEGTALLARTKEKELHTKYPVRFIEDAKQFDRFLSIVPEAATAVKSNVSAMHDVSKGGIFAALWEMAQGAGVGLEIDLKKLPLKQETVEVCEFFEISPYELLSGGCLLMTTDNGYDLVRVLESKNISAVVIGKTTESNDRVVINEEERRFLEPPKSDEIDKIITNQP